MKNEHERRYVYWDKEAIKLSIADPDEWNEKVETLNWDDYVLYEAAKLNKVLTLRTFWGSGYWTYEFRGDLPTVYIGFDIDHFEIWHFNPESNQGIKGFEALKVLKEKMKETNGKKLQARFGAYNQMLEKDLPRIQDLHEINRCVGPFIGNTSIRKNQYYADGLYKADVSSAYPAEGIYNLPDLRTAELVEGYVEPTEEWPIVFYLQHHHVAEYGVFDTHKDQRHILYRQFRGFGKKTNTQQQNKQRIVNKIVKPKRKNENPICFTDMFGDEEERCLRCKYSEYNLEEFLYFYEKKKDDELAKAVMNLAIGTFDFVVAPKGKVERCRMTYYGHLRAIICARHNHKMIQYYDEIVKKGYEVIQVQTDSIIWRGGPIDSAIRDKEIGKLHLEIENGRGFIHGCGAYWVEDANNVISKHQGIANWSDEIDTLDKFRDFFESDEYRIQAFKIDAETLTFTATEVEY